MAMTAGEQERGGAGGPVAREGGMCAGPEGGGPEAGDGVRRDRRAGIGPRFFRNGPRSDESLINFSKVWKF